MVSCCNVVVIFHDKNGKLVEQICIDTSLPYTKNLFHALLCSEDAQVSFLRGQCDKIHNNSCYHKATLLKSVEIHMISMPQKIHFMEASKSCSIRTLWLSLTFLQLLLLKRRDQTPNKRNNCNMQTLNYFILKPKVSSC